MSKKWLHGLFIVLLAGCASTPTEDRPWTQADEEAVAQLETAAQQAPPPRLLPPPTDAVQPESASSGPLLEVHVFNIGQADAMLVIGPGPARKTLLIDLGEPSHTPPGLGTSAEHVVRRIRDLTQRDSVDYFVLSHYHSDHAGFGTKREEGWGTGIIKVLSDFTIPFTVGEFIHVQNGGSQFMDRASGSRGVFRTITSRMNRAWVPSRRVVLSSEPRFGTTQIKLGTGVTVDILAFAGSTPGGSAMERAATAGVDYATSPANENDLSIALQITAGEFELFTAGDLSGTDDPVARPLFVPRSFNNSGVIRRETFTNVEDHMADEWTSTGRESDVEVYRANHHGSGFSTTPKLLAALDPELVLYSTGAAHGHPTNSVVQRVAATADQLATTKVTNPGSFASARGKVVGEITIMVARDGKSYTLNGTQHTAFTAAEERLGNDQ